MSSPDPFAIKITCPLCSSPDAVMTMSAVKCPNKACANHAAGPQAGPEQPPSQGAPALPREAGPKAAPMQGDFHAGANRLEIRYRNSRGEEKTFYGDQTSAMASGKHFSLKLEPTGRRVAFAKERILNWAEVKAAVPNPPPTKNSGNPAGCLLILLGRLATYAAVIYFVTAWLPVPGLVRALIAVALVIAIPAVLKLLAAAAGLRSRTDGQGQPR